MWLSTKHFWVVLNSNICYRGLSYLSPLSIKLSIILKIYSRLKWEKSAVKYPFLLVDIQLLLAYFEILLTGELQINIYIIFPFVAHSAWGIRPFCEFYKIQQYFKIGRQAHRHFHSREINDGVCRKVVSVLSLKSEESQTQKTHCSKSQKLHYIQNYVAQGEPPHCCF